MDVVVSIDIPEEVLVIELLSRLPLKSLARFKCVSKQWQHLISNAVIMRNDPKLFIFHNLFPFQFLFDSLDNKTCFESVLSQRELEGMLERPLEEDLLLPVREFRAHSSFNGLLLIQINKDLALWNPLTKFFRKVFQGDYWLLSEGSWSMLDLCFDHANNEYKILLVDKIGSWSYFSETFYVALCGSSSWEKVDTPDTVQNVFRGTNFNGYKHWICKGHSSPFDKLIPPLQNHIVYFDPSTNEFIEIAMPQPKKGDTNTIVGLGVLDGCLCMTRGDDPLS